MCCYRFSAFSIKKDVSEGIAEEQLGVVRRWRRTMLQVATEEMIHMALACNLLTAVGGKPHTRRPNLPSSPRPTRRHSGCSWLPLTVSLWRALSFSKDPKRSRWPRRNSPVEVMLNAELEH